MLFSDTYKNILEWFQESLVAYNKIGDNSKVIKYLEVLDILYFCSLSYYIFLD